MKSQSSRIVVFALVVAVGCVLALPAEAQFICAGRVDGATAFGPQGASAAGSTNNVACGTNANASGAGSGNTAFGNGTNASGAGSQNTATRLSAHATGKASTNLPS